MPAAPDRSTTLLRPAKPAKPAAAHKPMSTSKAFASSATPDQIQAALASVSWDLPSLAIEQESFRRIEEECAATKDAMAPECWRVARRLIHTTADTGIAPLISFRHDAVTRGVAALKACAPIVCDSRMIQAGLSLAKLARCNPSYTAEKVICHIADPDVAGDAARRKRTRALCAMDKARRAGELDGAIVLIGNAPLALAELVRLILAGEVMPALIVGMPVGFVNVLESKALLALCPVPHIALEGRRGGSPLAVATLHALLELVPE